MEPGDTINKSNIDKVWSLIIWFIYIHNRIVCIPLEKVVRLTWDEEVDQLDQLKTFISSSKRYFKLKFKGSHCLEKFDSNCDIWPPRNFAKKKQFCQGISKKIPRNDGQGQNSIPRMFLTHIKNNPDLVWELKQWCWNF